MNHREPYRLFFPLDIVCGIAGVSIWPLYYFRIASTYSGRSRALVQTIGFLYSFVAGFLLTEGMMMLLVLGVGGLLGPRLLGFPALASRAATRTIVYASAGTALLLSLVGEYGFEIAWLAVVRAVIVSAVMLFTMQPWRRPVVRTTLSWCVWTASWLIVGSVWLVAAAPRYRADFLHVVFIGGFTLLILAVGTRVFPKPL